MGDFNSWILSPNFGFGQSFTGVIGILERNLGLLLCDFLLIVNSERNLNRFK